jgi:cytochrome subunit of sulfide dehydrogenase
MSARLFSAAIIVACGGLAQAGSLDDGARLAESCAPCHGSAGKGGGSIPPLAGQDESRLARRMGELAAGDPQATIMTRLMRAYEEEEIAALARYFSGLNP